MKSSRRTTSAAVRAGGNDSDQIDSEVYGNKVRINHWHDKMMEHKKIYYASELKMYQLELALAKWDNANKLRWSVRHREFMNPIRHEEVPEQPEQPKKKRTFQPAFGYVPVTRQFTEDKNKSKNVAESKDTSIETQPSDVIPVHSEDYKPFGNTPSIHSYMYHLRKIYGK